MGRGENRNDGRKTFHEEYEECEEETFGGMSMETTFLLVDNCEVLFSSEEDEEEEGEGEGGAAAWLSERMRFPTNICSTKYHPHPPRS